MQQQPQPSLASFRPETPALVIRAAAASPFQATPQTANLLGQVADAEVFARACKKLASRVAKYGAIPACSAHDAIWLAARLPLLCTSLANLMVGRLSHSENRHFLHTFVPLLLRPGDAFAVYQEPGLAEAAAAQSSKAFRPGSFTDRHQMLVFVGSCSGNSNLEVDARTCTNMLDFLWPAGALWRALPCFAFDFASTECNIVEVEDPAQMARALVNAAATYVTRPGGCVTAFYYMGRYLAPVPAVLSSTQGMVNDIFDLGPDNDNDLAPLKSQDRSDGRPFSGQRPVSAIARKNQGMPANVWDTHESVGKALGVKDVPAADTDLVLRSHQQGLGKHQGGDAVGVGLLVAHGVPS